MAIRYEMAVGLNKGKKITKNIMKPRQSRRKGVSYMTSMALGPVTFGHMLPPYRYTFVFHALLFRCSELLSLLRVTNKRGREYAHCLDKHQPYVWKHKIPLYKLPLNSSYPRSIIWNFWKSDATFALLDVKNLWLLCGSNIIVVHFNASSNKWGIY